MQEIEADNFAPSTSVLCPPSSMRVVDWNINRGLQLQEIIEFLASVEVDLALLQETDLNARRTHHLNVAREISRELHMNYVFAREFEELSQGSRASPAYHGQATLCRWPLSNFRILKFQKQSNFWRPHWFLPDMGPFQERIGGRVALVCDASIAGKTLVSYNLHLESKGDDGLRYSQLAEALGDTRRYERNTPILLAGDLNLDVSQGPAAIAISRAHFQDAFSDRHVRTTPPRSFLDQGRIIDWILTRGPVRASESQVHRAVSASDHFPLSITLAFA
jgi:endonuclease/exonuclease/phosphatase family metal-dependent hydrolase